MAFNYITLPRAEGAEEIFLPFWAPKLFLKKSGKICWGLSKMSDKFGGTLYSKFIHTTFVRLQNFALYFK